MIKILPNRKQMDIITLIASVQLALAAFQLKLDHFSKSSNRNNQEQLERFYKLGEAIRNMEFAIAETVAFIGPNIERAPNPKLASLWRDASHSLRNIEDGASYADLAFEKNLYWSNPEFYGNHNSKKLYHISLENVLNQLRSLRSNYEKLQRKINV